MCSLYSPLYRQVGNTHTNKGIFTGNCTCKYSSLHTSACTHRWYPSHHNCSLSMLHCVMESETPCAALVLALNARRVILKTRLIHETAIKSEERSCCSSEAQRRWLLAQLICCSMWVASCGCVIVRGRNDRFSSPEMSIRIS